MEQERITSYYLEKRRSMYLEAQRAGRQAFFERSRLNLKAESQDEHLEDENENEGEGEGKEEKIGSEPSGTEPCQNLTIEEEFDEKMLIDAEKKAKKRMHANQKKREDFPSFQASSRSKNSKYLQLPEFLIDIPKDLTKENFIVLQRPEGATCTLTCRSGSCALADKSGRLLHKFSCGLPGGEPEHAKKKDFGCVLECIYDKSSGVIFIMDVLIWNCQSFIECSYDFRRFWILSNIKSPLKSWRALGTPTDRAGPDYQKAPKFLSESPLPEIQTISKAFDADAEGFRAAVFDAPCYKIDGLLFYLKQGWYCFGLSPYVLFWRDRNTSRYCGPSNAQEVQEEGITCLLRAGANGALLTLDEIEIDRVDEAETIGFKEAFLKKGLLKVSFISISIEESGLNSIESSDTLKLKSVGRKILYHVKSKTDRADNLSKILFGLRLQNDPITQDKILNALRNNEKIKSPEGPEFE